MNKNKHSVASIASVVLLLLAVALLSYCALSCSSAPVAIGPDSPGSGTGVGNGFIMGKVLYADSTPVAGAIVRLRPQTFLADTSGKMALAGDSIATVFTDASGRFVIDSVDTGLAYSIEVNNEKDSAEGTYYKFKLNATDTTLLPTRIVSRMPLLTGTIKLAGLPQNAYVQIFGLQRLGRTDSLGNFEIKELPVGQCEQSECEYRLNVMVVQPDGSVKVNSYELELAMTLNGNVAHVELELKY
jgi:hypothetical protein